VKYDMITGIGINFFGHSHPALMAEMINAVSSDVLQGNLEPGIESSELLAKLLSKVGKSRLKHGWLTTCGTMANEIGLKIIRQKRFPCTKILAFNDGFHGRSTAMQELTDNPKYREGQPVYGEVEYLPFYDAKLGLEKSTEQTLTAMRTHIHRYPCQFAAIFLELVQGEGGFNYAPRDFYVKIFEEAKKENLAIFVDEVQTFGRTGELFAFQTFELDQFVDVVTVAKMLQAATVLYTEEFNPRPGLVAGTFTGATVSLRTARKILELLEIEGFLGKDGKIEKLSKKFSTRLETMASGSCKGRIMEVRAIGGMIGFQPFDGSLAAVKAVLLKLFDHGVVAFYCGHGPLLIRMLPPLGAMTEVDVDAVCDIIEKSMLETQWGTKV